MSHPRIRILKLADTVQNFSNEEITNTPIEELLSYLHIMEELVHEDLDPVEHDEKLKNAYQVIRSFHHQLIIRMEKEQAQKILTTTKPRPWLRNYYFYKDYERLISKEQEMAGFTSYERLAYIGGGALPLSLILYHQLFGIRGVSIEKDPELAEISRKVLQKLDLSSHIHVIPGDETLLAEIEFEGFIVDAQAEPKKRVYTNLHAMAPSEAKIVCRSYQNVLLNSSISPEDLSSFVKIDECPPTGKANITSIMVRRREEDKVCFPESRVLSTIL